MALISNGSTVFDNGSMASGFGGSMVFIKKLTASSSATLSFVDGSDGVVLDDTYKEYVFLYRDIHPSANGPNFQIQFNDSSSNAVTKTSSSFYSYHAENDGGTQLVYVAGGDLAQSTNPQPISLDVTNEDDSSAVGYVHLFNPSSTTFVKHFIARGTHMHDNIAVLSDFYAGYCNTTSAVTEVAFNMQSGTFNGDVCLYGIA